MYVIVINGGEYAAEPDDVVGPFDTYAQADAFALRHALDDYDIVGLSCPDGWEAA